MVWQLYILLCLTFVESIFCNVNSTEYEDYTYTDEESMMIEDDTLTDGEKEEENKRIPKFVSISKSITANEGDTIKLPCLVDNLDDMVILWTHIPKGGDPNILAMFGKLLDKSNKRVALEAETNGNNLAIYLAELKDEGEYICQVADYNKTKIKHTVQIKVPEVKLSGGSTPREGNVFALNSEKEFGPVCDDEWGDDEARVVCRQLGYPGGSAVNKSNFGSVSSTFAMDGVRCSGSETKIQDCQYITAEDCGSFEGAGVICHDMNKNFTSNSKLTTKNEKTTDCNHLVNGRGSSQSVSETTATSDMDEQTSETTTTSNQDEQTREIATTSDKDEQTSDCSHNESGCESSPDNPETRSANFNVHLTLGISVFILVLILSGIAVVLYVRSKNKTAYNVDLFINRRY